MKVTAVTTALFFANLALGARFTENRRARAAKRAAQTGVRSGWSNPRLPSTGVELDEPRCRQRDCSCRLQLQLGWRSPHRLGIQERNRHLRGTYSGKVGSWFISYHARRIANSAV